MYLFVCLSVRVSVCSPLVETRQHNWTKRVHPCTVCCKDRAELSASTCEMHTCWGNAHTHTHTWAFTYVTFTSSRRRPLWSLCDQAKAFWILLNFFSQARIKCGISLFCTAEHWVIAGLSKTSAGPSECLSQGVRATSEHLPSQTRAFPKPREHTGCCFTTLDA